MSTHSWAIRQTGWEPLGGGYSLSLSLSVNKWGDFYQKDKCLFFFFFKFRNLPWSCKRQRLVHFEPPRTIKGTWKPETAEEKLSDTCSAQLNRHTGNQAVTRAPWHLYHQTAHQCGEGLPGGEQQDGSERVVSQGWNPSTHAGQWL